MGFAGVLPGMRHPAMPHSSLGALQARPHVGQHEAVRLVDGHEHHVVAEK